MPWGSDVYIPILKVLEITTLSPAGPVPSTVKVNGLRLFGRKPVNVTLPDEPAHNNNTIMITLRGTLAKLNL